jgi:hypothetical protein
MTSPNIMPTSTIPITSANGLRALAVMALACASAFVIWRSIADLSAFAAAEEGARGLRAAIAMEAGTRRDAQLDAAQTALQRALARHPDDGLSWSRLAEVRVVQATGAALGRVSPALLQASVDAGARAQALGRNSATDSARLAFALSLLAQQERPAAAALAASYAREPLGAGLAERRLPAARRVWAVLESEVRAAAQKEACASLADPLSQGQDAARLLQLALAPAEAPNAFCRRAGFASAS